MEKFEELKKIIEKLNLDKDAKDYLRTKLRPAGSKALDAAIGFFNDYPEQSAKFVKIMKDKEQALNEKDTVKLEKIILAEREWLESL